MRAELDKGLFIGTAAWTIAKPFKSLFPPDGSQLENYSKRLNAVEINSSFYRDHKPETYERWAQSVPANFKFSVKLSKVFTHINKLDVDEQTLKLNLSDIKQLGSKLGAILIQIPPKLVFNGDLSEKFFSMLRNNYLGPIAFEPRHSSWNHVRACRILNDHQVSIVIPDPAKYVFEPEEEIKPNGFVYYRLHGSPVIYKSDYSIERLKNYFNQMKNYQKNNQQVWCIFDNTTFGCATQNALYITNLINENDSTTAANSFQD